MAKPWVGNRLAEFSLEDFMRVLGDTNYWRLRTFTVKGFECTGEGCDRVATKGIIWRDFTMPADSKQLGLHVDLVCEESDGEILMTVDHIFPKSKGGTECIENLQPMCERCNARKGNKVAA